MQNNDTNTRAALAQSAQRRTARRITGSKAHESEREKERETLNTPPEERTHTLAKRHENKNSDKQCLFD